jgi:hypothetical protein
MKSPNVDFKEKDRDRLKKEYESLYRRSQKRVKPYANQSITMLARSGKHNQSQLPVQDLLLMLGATNSRHMLRFDRDLAKFNQKSHSSVRKVRVPKRSPVPENLAKRIWPRGSMAH